MSKLKTYKIRYKQTLGWRYVIKNPEDFMDYANHEEGQYVTCDIEDEVTVEAANKGEAKAMFAVAIAYRFATDPVPPSPIIRNAYRGIIDVTEVL